MSVVVQKFGGTSVADATKIMRAASRAVAARQAGHDVVVVVSARGKKTDELISLAAEITENPPAREMDMLLTTGEQESVALMAMAVRELGESAVSLTGAQIGVRTDSSFSRARIREISTERMRRELDAGHIVIAAGFQGIDDDFNITTLGRGGSDTTATALAAVLHADLCEIYTDVEGVFTTDPRLAEDARKVDRISYDEMLELASLGAGVMHSRSIEFAKKYNVHIRVRPAYSDGEGTLIAPEADAAAPVVTGLAIVRNEARVSLVGIPDRPGVMSLVFSKMADRKIPIDMVVQDVPSPGGNAEVSFTVPEGDLAETLTAAQESVSELGAGCVRHGTNLSKVSVVGAGMRTHTGVAAQMFASLRDAEVGIGMISTSEIKISVQVDRELAATALQAIHRGFELHAPRPCSLPVGCSNPNTPVAATVQSRAAQEVITSLGSMEDIVVSEVQLDTEQSRVTIGNLPDEVGVAARVFEAVANGGIMVDMIVQNMSHDSHASISFTVPRDSLADCRSLVGDVIKRWPDATLSHARDIAKLSVMGIGLRSHTGVGQTMFRALADADVNVDMINTSEIRISAVVSAEGGETAHRALLQAFGLAKE